MSREYIQRFGRLIKRLSKIACKKELERELNIILNDIIYDMGKIWAYYKENNYIISEQKKREFSWKCEKHHLKLNELVTEYKIFKSCPKCNEKLLMTTENFYIDRSRSDGLSYYCIQCGKKKQN